MKVLLLNIDAYILIVTYLLTQKRTREQVAEYTHLSTCQTCQGQRYNDKILACRINGKNIAEISELELNDLYTFVQSIT